MALMLWDPSFELGIHEFDEHHKQLVHLLNLSYDSFCFEAEHNELGAVLDELVDYATYHFAAEEHWMEACNYPGKSQHFEEHGRFSGRIVEIRNDFHIRKAHLNLEVMQFLKNWLIDHILKTDAAYAQFAKTAALNRAAAVA